ncbi:transcriptional regulator [Gordonia amicalis]|uniref:Transcriptional regulator n=1 Tax=Gordonia amicalis TaxID=89053 RepID=A0AAE4QZL6_9ACTN|nr:transcriptional regulator [Gordonia amicalis]
MSRATGGRREGGELGLLAAILRGMPNLRGAACVGSPGLFDPRDPNEDPDDTAYRHQAAARICLGCPALEPCRDWSSSQRGQESAVTAARTPKGPGRPGSRTRCA